MHFPSRSPEKKEVIVINETIILIENQYYKKHDHEGKELGIIEQLIRENAKLVELLGRLIPEPLPPRKIRPILAFNYLFKNKNLKFMAQVKTLTLISAAPVMLFMTVVDANNNNAEIAGVLSGLSYTPADPSQDIAVVDDADATEVDVHAVTNTGGTTVTGSGTFVSTLLNADGSPAFSGTVTGDLVLVNNIPVAVLNPVLAFNQ